MTPSCCTLIILYEPGIFLSGAEVIISTCIGRARTAPLESGESSVDRGRNQEDSSAYMAGWRARRISRRGNAPHLRGSRVR